MKRSEMVELIWNFVQKVEHDYDIYMEKDDCNNLLKKIEKAGMEPPLDLNNLFIKYETDDLILIKKERKWDKEND